MDEYMHIPYSEAVTDWVDVTCELRAISERKRRARQHCLEIGRLENRLYRERKKEETEKRRKQCVNL